MLKTILRNGSISEFIGANSTQQQYTPSSLAPHEYMPAALGALHGVWSENQLAHTIRMHLQAIFLRMRLEADLCASKLVVDVGTLDLRRLGHGRH